MWFAAFQVLTFDAETVRVTSDQMLDTALDKLIERKGAAELLHAENGPRLFVGVSNGYATLTFDPACETEPYRRIAVPGCGPSELITINVGNTCTEVEQRNCIPIRFLRPIVKYFYKSNQLLTSTEWEWEVDPG